jgi:prevent-host-death family protein
MSTQTIGLFEAKSHLSELVARAEQGDEVIITRHNRPVARIVPVSKARSGRPGRQAAIEALLAFEPIDMGDLSLEELIGEGRT